MCPIFGGTFTFPNESGNRVPTVLASHLIAWISQIWHRNLGIHDNSILGYKFSNLVWIAILSFYNDLDCRLVFDAVLYASEESIEPIEGISQFQVLASTEQTKLLQIEDGSKTSTLLHFLAHSTNCILSIAWGKKQIQISVVWSCSHQ